MGQDWEKKEQTDLYAYRHRKVKNKTKKQKIKGLSLELDSCLGK